MKIFLLLPLLLVQLVLNGQRMRGEVVNADDGSALAYVNVGLLGRGIGTVSDEAGRFTLNVPGRYENESVKFSLLGYEAVTLNVAELLTRLADGASILLRPVSYDLEEIVVVPEYTKTRVVGNPAVPARLTDGFLGNDLGREGGIIIKLRQRFRPAKVLKFQLHVANSTYEELKFRVNFYSVKNNIPFRPLTKESIIITSKVKSGVLEFDLSPYDIVVSEDFALTLEWIEDFGPGDLRFSFRRFGPRCVFRYASQDSWSSYSGLLAPSPNLNVTIGYR